MALILHSGPVSLRHDATETKKCTLLLDIAIVFLIWK